MSGILFDHFIFKSRRFTHRTKTIVFALIVAVVVGTWWHFRDCAWGIEGPAGETMKGRKWRKVSRPSCDCCPRLALTHLAPARRAGTFTTRQWRDGIATLAPMMEALLSAEVIRVVFTHAGAKIDAM